MASRFFMTGFFPSFSLCDEMFLNLTSSFFSSFYFIAEMQLPLSFSIFALPKIIEIVYIGKSNVLAFFTAESHFLMIPRIVTAFTSLDFEKNSRNGVFKGTVA
jgi:hypothetical protein